MLVSSVHGGLGVVPLGTQGKGGSHIVLSRGQVTARGSLRAHSSSPVCTSVKF